MLLTARLVLPMTAAPPIRDAAVLTKGARIVAVGPRAEVERQAGGHERRDFGDAIIMPGLVNAHIHLEYTHLGPIRERTPFFPWIRGLAGWSQERTPEEWAASTRDGAEQCVRGGVTCLGEIVSRGAGAEALAAMGLHGVAYAELVGAKNSDMPARWERHAAMVAAARAAVAARRDPGLRLGLSPHTPYTLPADAITEVARRAGDAGLPLAIHIAETAHETALIRDGAGPFADFLRSPAMMEDDGTPRAPYRAGGYGLTPAAYVAAQGLFAVGAPTLVIHGTHLDAADIALLARHRAAVALCPRSNDLLNCGAEAPVAALLDAGITLGVGTDSLASNLDLDLFAELRALAEIVRRQRPALDDAALARRLLAIATVEGARALALDDQLGTLAPGTLADLAVLPHYPAAAADPYRAILDHAAAADIRATIINGRIRYDGSGNRAA